jgi:hypothetical protein
MLRRGCTRAEWKSKASFGLEGFQRIFVGFNSYEIFPAHSLWFAGNTEENFLRIASLSLILKEKKQEL